MADYKRIELSGSTLHGVDRFGQWVTESIAGWHEPPPVRSDNVAIPGGHGEYALPSYYEGRTVTINGVLLFEKRSEAVLAMQGMRPALPSDMCRLAVTDAGQRTDVLVRVLGVDFTMVTRTAMRFQVRMFAPDPRRFGDARIVSAGAGVAAMVENRGSAPAWPKIVVPGAVSSGGYTITGPNGEKYVVTTSPSSSQTHYVDMWDGMLRVNSSMAAGGGLVGTAQTFTIPPGGKVPVTLSKGGRIELYDTYM